MPGWRCPECQRSFGRRNQSHECAPGMTLADYFTTGADFERPIFEAVHAHLRGLSDVNVEFLSVGIMFKRARTFAELRPMRNRVRLSVLLSRPIQDARIVKTWHGGSRWAFFFDLQTAAEVDDSIRDWLTEAYLVSPT